jgi:ribosomal protein S18 acetylase RimI-like enzyme
MTPDPGLIGQRVVVRHVVDGTGPSGGPAMTDVVGRVLAADEATLTVERRDGRHARVAWETVVALKPVPDRPLRRRRALDVDAEDLTRITSRGWPAIESELLGSWELRSSGSFTGRANSVAVHGDTGLPLDESLARVRQFYTSRGRPALAQVVVGSPGDRALTGAGWVPMQGYRSGAVVQVADLERSYAADPEVRVSARADDEWLAGYGRVDDPATARAVMEAPSTVGFLAIGEPTVAIGRVVVTGEWAGLSCVEVAEPARRRGLAGRIVRTSLAWAVEHGADKAYLQTMRSNDAALALYAPFGFVDHHDYRYLQSG